MAMKVFVFGSNRQGRHGRGAALHAAKYYGAVYQQGEGLMGPGIDGMCYALPTKQTPYQTLPLEEIQKHVQTFLQFARVRSDLLFEVTDIGCGLAGYTPEQIRPLFGDDIPSNVVFIGKLANE
jgi:hypothetical protein